MLRSSTARRLATHTSVSAPLRQSQYPSAASSLRTSSFKCNAPANNGISSFNHQLVGTSIRSLSSYSSLREPGSLFEIGGTITPAGTFSLEQAVTDRDAPLRADVRTMGSLLGQIIQDHHGEVIFDKIEELRSLAKAWRDAGAGRKQNADKQFAQLAAFCEKLDNEELHIISRAFTHFLGIANAAEGHHRSRLVSMLESENALPNKSDSCGGVLASLVKEHGSETILQALTSQKVELVLTAHPTEVNRRTILEKKRRVQEVRTNIIFFLNM
jgi:phosphoenolpyruvate carboxylase